MLQFDCILTGCVILSSFEHSPYEFDNENVHVGLVADTDDNGQPVISRIKYENPFVGEENIYVRQNVPFGYVIFGPILKEKWLWFPDWQFK